MAQIAVRMPKMSMTMTEGEVSEWFVGVGDNVSEGDVICEVLTDKVDMEVESPAAGVISTIVVESGSVDVGTPIAYIEGDDSGGFGDLLDNLASTAESESTPDAGAQPQTQEEPPPVVSSAPIAAVPRARTVAHDNGIDLAGVKGSGPDGLIVMADVESADAAATTAPAPAASIPTEPEASVAAATSASAAAPETAPAPTPIAPAPSPASVPAPAHRAPTQTADSAAAKPPSAKRAALVRARVAAKMTESAAVPQFTVWRDLVLDEANGRRNGVSWTTVLLSAYAASLREVPELLCRWDGSAAVESGAPSVGLAVATPYGLLAPVLPEPDQTDPADLDQRIRQIVATARNGRVDAAYLQVANGMLSNLGGLGVDRFQALVTPPQASVLSVGSIKQRPVAVAGGIGTALTVVVGLTIDHRVADGAHAAALLAALADKVSHWGDFDI